MREWKCSQELHNLLGLEKITRPHMMKVLWKYIKQNNLQNPQNKREILPDPKLAAVVGSSPISMFHLGGALGKHLS